MKANPPESSGPTGDADPPERSLDSSSEGHTAEANAIPPEPMETNGSPGEGLGSLPAARTEPGDIEETPGRSFDSPPERKARDPVDDLGESFGLLSVGRATSDSTSLGAYKHRKNRRQKHKQRGGKNPKPSATDTGFQWVPGGLLKCRSSGEWGRIELPTSRVEGEE